MVRCLPWGYTSSKWPHGTWAGVISQWARLQVHTCLCLYRSHTQSQGWLVVSGYFTSLAPIPTFTSFYLLISRAVHDVCLLTLWNISRRVGEWGWAWGNERIVNKGRCSRKELYGGRTKLKKKHIGEKNYWGKNVLFCFLFDAHHNPAK